MKNIIFVIDQFIASRKRKQAKRRLERKQILKELKRLFDYINQFDIIR